jgi:hypothetical protein
MSGHQSISNSDLFNVNAYEATEKIKILFSKIVIILLSLWHFQVELVAF